MDSAIGLSTMIAIGPERFAEMLSGFHAIDEHFRSAPFDENLPVLMGLLAVWNTTFLGAGSTPSGNVKGSVSGSSGLTGVRIHW